MLGLAEVHAAVEHLRGEALELLAAGRLSPSTSWKRSLSQARYFSSLCSSRATARMRPSPGSLPWRKAWNSAGISLRQVRSPVPPKNTRSNAIVKAP
jgi:hypothetical protein